MSHYRDRRNAACVSRLLAGAPILLYDGDCNLCSGLIDFVLAHERRPTIRFCAVQSSAGQTLLAHFGLPLLDWESNVFVENGRAHLRSASLLRLAPYLEAPWDRLVILRHLPDPLLDWCYDRVATNRYRLLGVRPECRLADRALRHRFIVSFGAMR